ncbi:K(lysine) acetyltransferase, partial [Lunasporangiospora selenospora]
MADRNSGNVQAYVEIGGHYGIIGKDGRECKAAGHHGQVSSYSTLIVEVLGKRVIDNETDVYIHYEGTDKRLDEWVDLYRLLPLKPSLEPLNEATTSEQDIENIPSGRSRGSLHSKKLTRTGSAASKESTTQSSRKKTDDVVHHNQDAKSQNSLSFGVASLAPYDHEDSGEIPRVRNVEWILYAGYDIATWYYSPFPDEYQDCQRLFICENCMKYIRHIENYVNHSKSCKRRRPPGV